MKDVGEFLSEVYFDEISSRERIISRIQFNFAIYASILAALSYMARRLDYDSNIFVWVTFLVFLMFSYVLIFLSAYHTLKAITGFKYLNFSSAKEVTAYRREVYQSTTSNVDAERDINDFAIEQIAECIDHNYEVNELRRKRVSRALWFLLLSLIPILVSSSLFVVFDLDDSSPRKNLLIEDRQVARRLDKLTEVLNTSARLNNNLIRNLSMTNKDSQEKSSDGVGQQHDSSKHNQSRGGENHVVPPVPVRPKPRVSTEDFNKDDGKSKLLNE